MSKLNQANWQYSIEYSEHVVKYYLNDLDCLIINKRVRENEKLKALKREYLIYLPLSDMMINLQSNQAYFDK